MNDGLRTCPTCAQTLPESKFGGDTSPDAICDYCAQLDKLWEGIFPRSQMHTECVRVAIRVDTPDERYRNNYEKVFGHK